MANIPFTIVDECYIHGGVSLHEGRLLANYAADVTSGVIVEVGSNVGGSTSYLAMGVTRAKKSTPIYAVDCWDLQELVGRRPEHQKTAVYERFLAQMRMLEAIGYVHPNLVVPIKGYSISTASTWDKPIGLLHVDALHTYAACKADLIAWAPHVISNGIIVVHDYFDPRFGCKKAADEFAKDNGYQVIKTLVSEWNPIRRGQIVLRKP